MLYVWGSGTKTVVAAQDIGVQRCEICENDQSYRAMLTYRYRHFWYLIRFVTSRKYAAYCNRCNNGHVIERAAIADKLASDPVPFMDRRGWMVGLGAIAALVGLVVVVGIQHDGEVAKMLAEPKVGDIYEAEISKVSSGFSNPHVYGLLRIVGIADGKATFEIAHNGYDKKKSASKDYREAAYKVDGYFDADDTATYSADELKALYDKRIIYDIDRP